MPVSVGVGVFWANDVLGCGTVVIGAGGLGECSNTHQSRITFRNHKFHNLDQSIIKKPSHRGRFRSLNILEGFKNVDSMVLSDLVYSIDLWRD